MSAMINYLCKLKSRTEILVPFAAIQAVPIAVIAWYRLHRYAWYRYSAIVNEVTAKAKAAFAEIRAMAERGEFPEMTLDEINEEIREVRRLRKERNHSS